jgi:flagellar biosynthesis protein FlhG
MPDQASPLRNLVLRESSSASALPRSRMIVTAGGKSGVGVTTTCVNLAVSLAKHGLRTVLIDADLQQPAAAVLCGCALSPGLGEVLASKRDIHEVLQRGPAGLQLIPGVVHGNLQSNGSSKFQQRLLRQLNSLGKHVDVIVIDAGSAATDFARQLWATADEVLLVTAPDVVAVMDTYAAVKTMYTPASVANSVAPRLRIVVNQSHDDAEATDVFRRIDQSCQRFLDIRLQLAAALPLDDQAKQAQRHGVPVTVLTPQSPLSRAIDQFAHALVPQDDLSAADLQAEFRRAA